MYRAYCINRVILKGKHRGIYRRLETKVLEQNTILVKKTLNIVRFYHT